MSKLSFVPVYTYQYLCSLSVFIRARLFTFLCSVHNLSLFFTCYHALPCPCLCLSGNYTPSFPCCQILAQTCSASHPSSFQCHVQLAGCTASLPTAKQPCTDGGILFQMSFVLSNTLLRALVRGISPKRRALCTKSDVICKQHSQRKVWWLQSAFCFCSSKSSGTQGATPASAPKEHKLMRPEGMKRGTNCTQYNLTV